MATRGKKRTAGNGGFWPWMQMMPMAPMANGGEKTADDINAFFGDMVSMGQEFSKLYAARARAYMELPKVMSECRHPEDIMEVESEFWSEAFNQYKEFSTLSLPGNLTVLSGMIEGHGRDGAQKTASKSVPKRQAATRKKSPRKSAKRRDTGNGRALYTFPEHVEGRPEVRGRVH